MQASRAQPSDCMTEGLNPNYEINMNNTNIIISININIIYSILLIL